MYLQNTVSVKHSFIEFRPGMTEGKLLFMVRCMRGNETNYVMTFPSLCVALLERGPRKTLYGYNKFTTLYLHLLDVCV